MEAATWAVDLAFLGIFLKTQSGTQKKEGNESSEMEFRSKNIPAGGGRWQLTMSESRGG